MKTKTLIIIFAVLLICAACAYFLFQNSSDNTTAVITVNGEVVNEIDLSLVNEAYTINIEGSTVLVEKGRIRMQDADCPDKLCVKTGYTSGPSKPIVCLPKQIVINVTAASDGLDAVAR